MYPSISTLVKFPEKISKPEKIFLMKKLGRKFRILNSLQNRCIKKL
jgi:hypothetical protein